MTLTHWSKKFFKPDLNEHQLLSLFNSLSDVIILLNEHQQIVTVNNSWSTLVGTSALDAIDQSFPQFLHPEDIPHWRRLLSRIRPGKTELIWLRLINHQGDIRWCEIRIQSVNPNRLYPLSATLCDITPQVRSDQIREATHRSLQSLVDRLPAMLYRSRNNVSWTMEYVSSGCEAVTGYPAEELLNQTQISLGDIIHPEDAPHVWEDVQTCLGLQQPFNLNYRIIRSDGVEIHVRDKGHGLYSESGLVMGVEGIILQI